MIKYIAALVLIPQLALANNAITVKEGYVVPKEYNQGTLMDKPTSDKIKDELIDKDALKKINESLEKSIML